MGEVFKPKRLSTSKPRMSFRMRRVPRSCLNPACWVKKAQDYGVENMLPSLSWMEAVEKNEFEGNENGEIDVSDFKFDYGSILESSAGYSPFKPNLDSLLDRSTAAGILLGSFIGDGYSIRAYGNGIRIETPENMPFCQPHPDVTRCFAFSYFSSQFFVSIDLVEHGIDEWVLDYVRPKIRITQKVNKGDGGQLMLAAQLNTDERSWRVKKQRLDERLHKEMGKVGDQWNDDWEDWTIEFDHYPSEVRHLVILNEGCDGMNEKGYHGPKFANLTVQVLLPEIPTLKPWENMKKVKELEASEDSTITDPSFWIQQAMEKGIENVLPSLAWREFVEKKDGKLELPEEPKFDYKTMVLSSSGYSPFQPRFDSLLQNNNFDGIISDYQQDHEYEIHPGGDGIFIHYHHVTSKTELTQCFNFSYRPSEFHVAVDLVKRGIDEWVLDYVRPKIRVTQKVSKGWNKEGTHLFAARLNSEANKHASGKIGADERLCKKLEKTGDQWSDDEWEDWTIEFDDYPSGMRHLTILNEGSDGIFWAGFYGPQIANMTIQAILPDDPVLEPFESSVSEDSEDEEYLDSEIEC